MRPFFLVLASAKNDEADYDTALALLPKGMRLLPSAWQGHAEMARALLGKGDTSNALREIAKTESLVPATIDRFDAAYIHFLKARVLAYMRDFANARLELEVALRTDPRGPVGEASRRVLESSARWVWPNIAERRDVMSDSARSRPEQPAVGTE